ncbi:hypothetical protein ERO13_A10G160800v2 [Gossypium hirsutum]|uniref:Alpha-soluble NSF attachment protein n=1 Tax=Gossypium hirsutum TaxID=3635 RepID=A0A1U8IHC3_GOSHI|nr:alpha-soluble NSF attachment protein [Gossypium hirsutum]KAG4180358.1 hypothetical protein ERO13_A10G160800v2 [Gossypium hirsutum]
MGDQLARGEEFEQKAEKKLSGWGLFGSKHEDAAELFDKAANCFKLAKSWDKAGSTYVKLANCNLKLESKHEAAQAYVDAAHCYKKTNVKEAISCLKEAVNMFCDIGRLSMAAKYYKEIAELYESEQNTEQAIDYYEKAADFFQNEDISTSANQCKQKVAQFAAQIEQYQKAVEIYEDIARQSLSNNLLKYGAKGHLLNAGICQLCKGDVAITNALERYQELDPTFSGTREYKFLADIASSIDEEDVTKFTDVVKEFDSMSPLDSWKTTLLLRVKEKLKAKEMEEDDLT